MYEGRASDESWWPSRYGADDRTGSLNELTQEIALAALALPTLGRVLELAPVLDEDMPARLGRGWRQVLRSDGGLRDLPPLGPSDAVGFEEIVTGSTHLGCHVDGLAHYTIGGRGYNGVPYGEFFHERGMRDLGAEHLRPWLTRGVCLDIASVRGVERLASGDVIAIEDLERASEVAGVEIMRGDAVLLHTGWMSLWGEDDSYHDGEPGLGWDAAHWLTDRRVSLVGVDNWGCEAVPFEDDDLPFAVSQHLLAETGTYILKNVRTDELAAVGAGAFLFVLAPIKGAGSTGAQAAPLAIL